MPEIGSAQELVRAGEPGVETTMTTTMTRNALQAETLSRTGLRDEVDVSGPVETGDPWDEEPVEDDLKQVLDAARREKRRWYRRPWLFTAALVLIAASFFLWGANGRGGRIEYRTVPAETGTFMSFVTATGTLEPTNQVDVGSELSGIVRSVEVDVNDQVTVGQVLARLETSKLEAQARQSRAALEAAEARLAEAQATVREKRIDLERVRALVDQAMIARNNLDAAQAAFDRAQAEEASARAQMSQALASLNTIETDLGKAVIRSPIDGLVLERNVEPGQTVAASFQAPVLFLLAEDLRHMELHVAVDEADVSQVRDGQLATFTVDAYPDRTFPATVQRVHYASKTVEGVVTYEAVLSVDNSELLLRPGMTATADVTTETIEGALLVPNAALRFTQPVTTEAISTGRGGLLSALMPRPPMRPKSGEGRPGATNGEGQRVWTLREGLPQAISVTTGPSDGTRTVIVSGDIDPGLALIVESVTVSQ